MVGESRGGAPEPPPAASAEDGPAAGAVAEDEPAVAGVPAADAETEKLADAGKPADAVKPDDEGEDTPAQVTIDKWQFYGLLAVLIVLLAVLIAAFAFKGDTDSVTGIIGAALPPFATIAAAIFGVKAVYDSGKATGEATGRAKGEANKDEAVKEAQDRVARAIAAPLRRARADGSAELVGRLRRAGLSPRGRNELRLIGPEPSEVVVLPAELLESAERPGRDVEVALAVAEQYMRRPPRNRARR